MQKSIIREKSFYFAKAILALGKELKIKKEYELCSQLVRSGTSIGANVHEAMHAQSTADFYTKMCIAFKEARETEYWLRLLAESDYGDLVSKRLDEIAEILRILSSITKTIKDKRNS